MKDKEFCQDGQPKTFPARQVESTFPQRGGFARGGLYLIKPKVEAQGYFRYIRDDIFLLTFGKDVQC
jgi:hypothetical protein